MIFKSEEIHQIAGTVWETMLGIPVSADVPGASASPGRATAACIHITGGWNGAVFLCCPGDVARRAAAAMFSTDPISVSPNDLQDAVAELVNMIGGNIKGLLPGECQLSLPAVVEGSDFNARIPGSRLVNRIAFGSEGHTVTVSVMERIGASAPAA